MPRWQAEDDNVDIVYRNVETNEKFSTFWSGRKGKMLLFLLLIVLFFMGLFVGYLTGKHMQRVMSSEPKSVPIPLHVVHTYHPIAASVLLGYISTSDIRGVVEYLSQENRTFLDADQFTAKNIRLQWEGFGLDKVEVKTYDVLVSVPNTEKESFVEMLNTSAAPPSGGSLFRSSFPGTTGYQRPFMAYSPSGDVSGPLVYANYGRREDFEWIAKQPQVTVNGSIVLVRYGKIYRGDKVSLAYKYGAKAVIMYPDPEDFSQEDGLIPTSDKNTTGARSEANVNPPSPFSFLFKFFQNGPRAWNDLAHFFEPKGQMSPYEMMREDLLRTSTYGDPLTPGYGATKNQFRLKPEDADLPKIPVHPITADDAQTLFALMDGVEVQVEWRGKLNATKYMLNTKPNLKVRVTVNNEQKRVNISNVIGTILGAVELDRYVVVGNHRDAWFFGGVDPASGVAIHRQVVYAFGQLRNLGYRPRRTIIFASWDAAEYGFLGSTEWVEENARELQERTVAYINIDAAITGNYSFAASASPLLAEALNDVTSYIKSPTYPNDALLYDWLRNFRDGDTQMPKNTPLIPPLGAESDYTPFYHGYGIPSVHLEYIPNPDTTDADFFNNYHRRFNPFETAKAIDPDFSLHTTLAQTMALLTMKVADRSVLLVKYADYGRTVRKAWESFTMKYTKLNVPAYAEALALLNQTISNFVQAAVNFDDASTYFEGPAKLQLVKDPYILRAWNDHFVNFEKAFIYEPGLPNQPLYRHLIFSPSSEDAYRQGSFSGIVDILQEKDVEPSRVNQQILLVVNSLELSIKSLRSSLAMVNWQKPDNITDSDRADADSGGDDS